MQAFTRTHRKELSVQLFLTWFELFLSLALVVAVLVHPAKGMGLGSMGGSAQLFGSQKGAETGLNRLTGTIIVLWMGTALLLSSHLLGVKSTLPIEQTPIQMPARQAPVSAAPAQQAPTSAAPAQQAPVSAAPAQQAPASAAPAQQAPVSAAPAQQAPASAAPKVPTDTKPST